MSPSGGAQREVQSTIDALVASGTETGLQVAVLHEGRMVVDAVAGVADTRTGEPVSASTLFFAASTGKGVATTVAHLLAYRRQLSYEQPLAEVWPEFAAHGKERVTLTDVLVHSAGVPGLWPKIAPEDLCDSEMVCAFIADETPWWTPGTKTGYHALTFGFLLDALIRRTSGRTIASVLRQEIAAPLGIVDELHFGVPEHVLARVARQGPEGASPPRPAAGSPLDRAVPPGVRPTAAFANRPDVLRADIPSQGTMTARAVARMYSALLGHIDEIQLASPELLRKVATPAFSGIDQVMGFPTTWALGYSPARLGQAGDRPGSTIGMIGSNGTAAYADIDSGVAVAVMRNQIDGGLSAVAAIDDIIAAHYG